jgi:hypothetical protein
MRRSLFILSVLLLLPDLVHGQDEKRVGSQPGHSAKGAMVKVITEWDSSCTGNTRGSWDNMCDSWYDEICNDSSEPSGHGSRAWWKDSFVNKGSIRDPQFVDYDRQTWGIDMRDGNHTSGRWYGKVYINASSADCKAEQNDIRLGDFDLEFLHLSSCHSMCEDNWDEWEDSFDGLHQINGFHGLMYIWAGVVGRYGDFAEDAYDLNIAEAWVDNHHSLGVLVLWPDHCPVSMVAGHSTASSAETRLSNTEYDWTFEDPTPVLTFTYDWVGGCSPSEESALP